MQHHRLAPFALLAALAIVACDVDETGGEQQQLRNAPPPAPADVVIDLGAPNQLPQEIVHVQPGDYVMMGDRATYAGISQDASTVPQNHPIRTLRFGTQVVAHTAQGPFSATFVGFSSDGTPIFSSPSGNAVAQVEAFFDPIVLVPIFLGMLSCVGNTIACDLSCLDRVNDCIDLARTQAEWDCCFEKHVNCVAQCALSCGIQGHSVDFGHCTSGGGGGGGGGGPIEVLPNSSPRVSARVHVTLHNDTTHACTYLGSAGVDGAQIILGHGLLTGCQPL